MRNSNPEMACGKNVCTNAFRCKVAACDFGDAVRTPKSMASDCANNGGCGVETGKTPNCLAAQCERAKLLGTGQEFTLPSTGKEHVMPMSRGTIEFRVAVKTGGV